MTDALSRLLGRLPIGWLQLIHNRTRFAAALAGVMFANILIFMQLGFLGALVESISLPYRAMHADILLSASDANTLTDGSPLPRQRMFEALSVPGVASATPIYFGKMDWKQPDGTIRSLDVFGIDPAVSTFKLPEVNASLDQLKLLDYAVIDRRTRNVAKAVFASIDGSKPYEFEVKGRTITITSTFALGGGFTADGYLVMSDQSFIRHFPQRVPGAPNHVLVRLAPGADRTLVVDQLKALLPAYDTAVRTIDDAIAKDQAFQTTQRPVGIVFGFGIVIGVLVGIVIVYQVLSTDVADHIREYATFKAMGYPQSFFLGVVFEEALILALLGFVPGIVLAIVLYAIVASVTGLPLAMTPWRAVYVLLGTIAMCGLSGAIATQRLARANPADLY
jgi:putative ABC transport system permease protein